jgi:structure-specific recognition protein 1
MQNQYKDKLQAHYEEPIHQVVTKIFRGLSGKKVIMPSKDFVSHHGHHGVKCSIKANEGLLYFLDKSLMFVPKPATYIQMENIAIVTMSRVGGAVSASRTFDITVSLKGGLGEHQFSNINRYVLQIIFMSHVLTFPVRSKNRLRTSSRPRTFALRTRWPRRYVLSLPVS